MKLSTSQLLKFTVALGFVLIASVHSVWAQGSVYSAASSKTPPSPEEVFSGVKSQPKQVSAFATKPGTRGLWGSNGELKLLPPVDGSKLSPNSDSTFVQNKKLPPLPTDTIKKPVARLANTRAPASYSRFSPQTSSKQLPAKPINWNQPSVVAGPLPNKWAVSQATSVKETKIATAPEPVAKIENIEAKIVPSYAAPAQPTSRYSVYREAKQPRSVASAINQQGPAKPSQATGIAPVSQPIPPMIKRPSNKPVIARISDQPIEEQSEGEYSPIMACRLLGLKPVNSDEVTER